MAAGVEAMSMHVIKPGMLTTVQDGGRVGHGRLGVAPSGAMDAPALQLANALVGNAASAPALEITLRGPELRFEHPVTIALTGADIEAHIGGEAIPMWRPVHLPAQTRLSIGSTRRGMRSYLAIAGGLLVPRWLGSAAVDRNAGIGAALAAGQVLAIGVSKRLASYAARDRVTWPNWSLAPAHWFDAAPRPLRAVAGSHFHTLDAVSRAALFGAEFRIGRDADRAGYRLQGPALASSTPLELISEAVDFGTLQLPPGGDPIVLMAEHPTSGGYPRIAQVAAADLPRLAQRRPGEALRFERIDAGEAERLHVSLQRALARLLDDIVERLR
jgi:biotin-dependent carboxylase-like uncharacterized protein